MVEAPLGAAPRVRGLGFALATLVFGGRGFGLGDAEMAAYAGTYGPRAISVADGALWYHADHVAPDWSRKMAVIARIGRRASAPAR